jgi:S1-C subfamily serine protease
LPVVDLASVVEQVKPAVVTVVNQRQVGDLLEQREQEAGRGTGFIIDQAGHVVTNEHVVRGGDAFQVILSDGSVRPATVVGADPQSDLAVVRIEGDGEAPAVVEFGDSEALRQGQPVLAIGSPLGDFTGTVTDGIVSALNRDFPGAARQGEAPTPT